MNLILRAFAALSRDARIPINGLPLVRPAQPTVPSSLTDYNATIAAARFVADMHRDCEASCDARAQALQILALATQIDALRSDFQPIIGDDLTTTTAA